MVGGKTVLLVSGAHLTGKTTKPGQRQTGPATRGLTGVPVPAVTPHQPQSRNLGTGEARAARKSKLSDNNEHKLDDKQPPLNPKQEKRVRR
jgi:hypothetical protein